MNEYLPNENEFFRQLFFYFIKNQLQTLREKESDQHSYFD